MTASRPALRGALRTLLADVLAELDPARMVARHLSIDARALRVDGEVVLPLPGGDRPLRVLAVGKAAAAMARGLGEAVAIAGVPLHLDGLVVHPAGVDTRHPPGLRPIAAGHPRPDPGSVAAAEAAQALLTDLEPDDAVLCLLSGGGSSLLEAPLDPGIELDALRSWHRTLVDSGADIQTVNLLRKRVSAVKGGRLGARAHPARLFTWILSDVPPGMPEAVASGPTLPDPTTNEAAVAAWHALRLERATPEPFRRLLQDPSLPETPKPDDPRFAGHGHAVLADSDVLRDTALTHARRHGWHAEPADVPDDLTSEELATRLLARLDTLAAAHPDRTVAVVSAGESSVELPARRDLGRGGRNQSFVLACLDRIAGRPVAVLGAGSDGVDGSAPAAGAVADGDTRDHGKRAGADLDAARRRFDAHGYFHEIGADVVTGPTGNNLRDLRVLVREPG